jgi:hypothetical protein
LDDLLGGTEFAHPLHHFRSECWEEKIVAAHATTAELILEALAIAETTGCSFEQLISACPGLGWNQIFLEVDRLSREGSVHLRQDRPGLYRIRLPKQLEPAAIAMSGR